MVKSQNQDLSLKLRFRRILFCQGYWCPIEVELSQYEGLVASVKRISLTDLDVLGYKYDSLFAHSLVVGDCRTGKNFSDVNRLFWLKGVSEYFGADQAYFIHPVVKSHTRGIAPKLGLRVIDESSLIDLEKNLDVSKFPLPVADTSTHQNITNLWGIDVAKGDKPTQQQSKLKEVYSYLSYSYWYIERHRNIFSIIEHFANIAQLLDPRDSAHLLLAYTGLERFAHSLLEAASFVFAQGTTNVPRDTRSYIYGGPLALKEKEAFFQLLRRLTGSFEQLDPPYLQDIIELLGRMVRNPNGACDILRHINAIYIWCVHLKNATLLPLNSNRENTAAIVLARDAAKTFAKTTGLREELYSAILML